MAGHLGELLVTLTWRIDRIVDVEIVVQRPLAASVLVGREPETAVALVPQLFALCGKAQGTAASLALAAARGVETPPRIDSAVLAEGIREHLWQLLLDLPSMLNLPARRDLAEPAFRAVARGDRAGLAQLLDDPFWTTLEGEWDALPRVAPVDTLLPALHADATRKIWPVLDRRMARWPTLGGEPAETGAYARLAQLSPAHDNPLVQRWLARLDEVRFWVRSAGGVASEVDPNAHVAAPSGKAGLGCTSATAMAPGVGRAVVSTARGMLMHEVTLRDERIADYVIVAPTEWNFHPAGVLADWLIDAPATTPQIARDITLRAVATLDPCVVTRIVLLEE